MQTHLLNNLDKVFAVKIVELTTELPQASLVVLVGFVPGDDGDDNALDGIAAEGNLGRVARAEALASWKREAGQVLEE